jgi:tRNA threonylcarbamoyl adenosine modification protein (Sua5/YciO/YrdC/YwlC family)
MLILNMLSDPQIPTLLAAGKVGVLPTDTVYGLACSAHDQAAVAKLYSLKARENKPGTLIAANIDQLVELGLKRRYLKAVEHLWPNPISIEIPHHIEYLHQGTGRQAFRVVKDEALAKLLVMTGPLQTTSANHPGAPTANTVKEAMNYFNEEVDFYVDGGDLSSNLPSTVIRIIDDAIEVVRPGAVIIDEETGRIQPAASAGI